MAEGEAARNAASRREAREARKARRRVRRLRRRGLAGVWRSLGYRIRRPFIALRLGTRRVATHVNKAADRSLGILLDAVRKNRVLKFLFGPSLRRAVIVLFGFGALIALIIENIFMVGVTDNAVILRLGKYDRIIEPGLAFKYPFIEQKYMVNTQMRLQEDFGFIQYTPPPKPQTEREQDRAAHEADVVLEANEANVERRGTGVVTDEILRAPPLPRDFAVSLDPAPVPQPDPQAETEEVLERIDLQHEALENVIPPDGKVPVPEDMKMLTGDLNIVYVTWSVQYEIIDAKAYLFQAVDITETLRDLSVVAMRTAVGDRLDSDILSRGRAAIADSAKRFLQAQVDRYNLGLDIKKVIIMDANPPDEVRGAFHMVNQAKQEMEDQINRAQAEYNSIIPQAHGKASRLVSEAKAYALDLGNRSKGEASRFMAILREYRGAPEVTRDRYYIEAMEDLYARMSVTLVDSDLKGILPIFEGRGRPPAQPAEPMASTSPDPAIAALLQGLVDQREQPMLLPQSTAVRDLPWEPQAAPEMPPPSPAASTSPAESAAREVAPVQMPGGTGHAR